MTSTENCELHLISAYMRTAQGALKEARSDGGALQEKEGRRTRCWRLQRRKVGTNR